MVDRNNAIKSWFIVERTTTAFSYLVAGGKQDAYIYTASGTGAKRMVGTLFLKNFTAARKITVTVEEYDGAAYGIVDSVQYTVGTDPNPHFDFQSSNSMKVTMTIDIVEAGNISTPMNIDVIQVTSEL